MPARSADALAHRTGVCLALAALVFAGRAWLIGAWGSPVPYWDQWDAEAALYRGWLTGGLGWRDLFAAHNEHRIALTRLADLASFALDGRWNPWGQLFLNGALHAATAAALAAVFWPALAPRARAGFVAGLAVLFSATSGWQNALWGFQSQVYFATLLAVGAIAGVALGAPFRRTWWLGWLAALLGLFADAGGLIGAAVALVVGFAAALTPTRDRRHGWAVLALALVVALGGMLQVSPAHHDPLRAQSTAQFFGVFARCLGWPQVDCAWAFVLTQLPLAWLALDLARRRTRPDTMERAAFAFGLYAILHAAAVAYSRGGGLVELRPLSRYQDPLLLGVAAQLYAALRLARLPARPGRLALVGWLATIAVGLGLLTETNLTLHLAYKRAQDRASLAQVRTYLATSDPTVFARDPAFPGPHPDPQAVVRVLRDPVLHPVLPAAFFAADEIAAAQPPWLARHGAALTLIAAVGLVATLAASLAAPPRSDRSDAPVPAPPGA